MGERILFLAEILNTKLKPILTALQQMSETNGLAKNTRMLSTVCCNKKEAPLAVLGASEFEGTESAGNGRRNCLGGVSGCGPVSRLGVQARRGGGGRGCDCPQVAMRMEESKCGDALGPEPAVVTCLPRAWGGPGFPSTHLLSLCDVWQK